MKAYPTITYNIDKSLTIYAFDKLDGSNIRAEWTIKNGFHKFGTRRRLLDPNEEPLGEAVSLINEKYGEDLARVFYDNKFGRAIAFFEFWGLNSFAGLHEDETHTVTLIDVNPYKRGILSPQLFLKLFGDLDIPNYLYFGKVNNSFIEQVRNGELPGMTFEGVVCKGMKKKNLLTMFKIKSRAWIIKVKEEFEGDRIKLGELLDKTEMLLGESKKYRQRRFCPSCFRNGSLSPVCKCGAKTLQMEFEAQPPRKRASKTRWRKFFQDWYSELDFNRHWKERS